MGKGTSQQRNLVCAQRNAEGCVHGPIRGWELITLIFVRHPHPPVGIPIAAGLAWSIIAFALISYITAPATWSNLHRWALAFGATLACTLPGYLSTNGWPRIDLVGKVVFQMIGLAGFMLLLRFVLNRRPSSSEAQAA